MQTQKVIQEILSNHLKHDLTEADRGEPSLARAEESTDPIAARSAALAKASRQLLSHASTGLWIGSTVGAALAFRSRWASALRNLKSAKSPAGAASSIFYPKVGQGLESASKAADAGMSDAAKSGRSVRFILKGLGFGLLGGFVGTQIGVVTGTLAGRKTIQTEGNEERIAKAIRKISIELNERVGTKTAGTNGDGSFNNGFKSEEEMSVPDESYYGKRMVEGDEFENADPSTSAPRKLVPLFIDVITLMRLCRYIDDSAASISVGRPAKVQRRTAFVVGLDPTRERQVLQYSFPQRTRLFVLLDF